MGVPMSIMGRGMTGPMEKFLYDKILHLQLDKNITEFDDFQIDILEVINTINSAVPGNRYEVPNRNDIQDLFDGWKSEDTELEKERLLRDFVCEKVKIGKGSNALAVTGLVAPPMAMVLRKKGEQKLAQVSVLKFVPDAVFVPFVTLLALTSVKLGRRLFH